MPANRQHKKRSPPSEASAPATYDRNRFRTESWLQEQPAGNFTIQLMAAGSEATVKRYIEHYGIKNETAYARTLREGRPWYFVTYRSFRSFQAARSALEQLPPALSEAKPWVRRFEEIQASLDIRAVPDN